MPASADTVQTVVLLRHGEKPADGLGQLTCQGLNRALALPAVIEKTFGKPVAVFAPDPSSRKKDGGVLYDYVRPLATIEPSAIAFGLPIHADFALNETDALIKALDAPAYADGLVLVAWEHSLVVDITRDLLATHGGDGDLVPKWRSEDFDGLFVVTIARSGGTATARFARKTQGLDGLPTSCPH